MAALTGSEPPDVLVLSGSDLVKSYYREGLVDDLSGAIKAGNIDMNDFFEAPLQPWAHLLRPHEPHLGRHTGHDRGDNAIAVYPPARRRADRPL